MLDIKEIYPEFQKINKTDNCIVLLLKNETKLAITSPVSIFFQSIESVKMQCQRHALSRNALEVQHHWCLLQGAERLALEDNCLLLMHCEMLTIFISLYPAK